jgi:predicted DNA-binding transcriptional regulator YafY
MHHLLSNLDSGGLLGGHIEPLLTRLTALLGVADDSVEEVRKRIKVEMVGVRQVHLPHFEVAGSALLRRKRILIDYYARGTDEMTRREISPQRMIYYRGNWYMDAWCHMRNDLRSFSIDAIRRVEMLEKKTKDVAEKHLNEVLSSGYGIFAGKKVKWATLLFSSSAVRWVSTEKWHPDQKGTLQSDGSYELKVPYSQDTELVMDILKYGAGVKVVSPVELVKRVSNEIEALRALYSI